MSETDQGERVVSVRVSMKLNKKRGVYKLPQSVEDFDVRRTRQIITIGLKVADLDIVDL